MLKLIRQALPHIAFAIYRIDQRLSVRSEQISCCARKHLNLLQEIYPHVPGNM